MFGIEVIKLKISSTNKDLKEISIGHFIECIFKISFLQ